MTCSREISNNRGVYRSEVSSTGRTKLTPFCVRRNTLLNADEIIAFWYTFGFDILDNWERGLFHHGGDPLVSVNLWRTLDVTRIRHLSPFVLLGKVPRTKFPFRIIRLTLFSWPQQELKTMPMQSFGGRFKSITVFLKRAYYIGV